MPIIDGIPVFKEPKLITYHYILQRPKKLHHYVKRSSGGLRMPQTFIYVKYRGWRYIIADVGNNPSEEKVKAWIKSRFPKVKIYKKRIADETIIHGAINKLTRRYKHYESIV